MGSTLFRDPQTQSSAQAGERSSLRGGKRKKERGGEKGGERDRGERKRGKFKYNNFLDVRVSQVPGSLQTDVCGKYATADSYLGLFRPIWASSVQCSKSISSWYRH